MISLLISVLRLSILLCMVHGQKDCDTECIPLSKCEVLHPLIKMSSAEREKIKQYHCGFEGIFPNVCCPTSIALPSTDSPPDIPKMPSDSCITLEGTFGACVPLKSCPQIVEMLKTKSKASVDYASRSKCINPEGPREGNVCCTTNFTPSSVLITKEGGCVPTPLPTSGCCGVESASGNKIIGGQEASIDQFPWLALIEYVRPQLCGGSLISAKYVLTAAHCILNKANKPRGAIAVRLGEYNTATSGPDCVQVEGGGKDCTPGDLRIPIASALAHPQYNNEKVVAHANDIALITLSEMAPYTDFIRPICLPKSDITRSQAAITFFVAGWGAVNLTQATSNIKMYVDLAYVDYQNCRPSFNTMKGSLVWEKQICAGDVVNKDSCKGDSGGPLMVENGKVQEVAGVISFGFLQCGLGKPSVYTKVFDYLPWIYSVMEP